MTRKEYWIVFARRIALVLLAVALVQGLLVLRSGDGETSPQAGQPAGRSDAAPNGMVARAGIVVL